MFWELFLSLGKMKIHITVTVDTQVYCISTK